MKRRIAWGAPGGQPSYEVRSSGNDRSQYRLIFREMSGFFEAPRRSVSRRSTAPKVRRRAAARGVRADSTAAPRSRRRRALSRRPPRDRGVAAGSGSRRSASAASSASRRSTAASRSAPTCSRAPRRLRAMRPAPPISFLACFRAGHFSQRRARPAAFSGRAPARLHLAMGSRRLLERLPVTGWFRAANCTNPRHGACVLSRRGHHRDPR